jgi:uncharacterized coiled-coil protein SlyX
MKLMLTVAFCALLAPLTSVAESVVNPGRDSTLQLSQADKPSLPPTAPGRDDKIKPAPSTGRDNPFLRETPGASGDPLQRLDKRLTTLEYLNLAQIKSLAESLQRRVGDLEEENRKLRRDLDDLRNRLNVRPYR